MKREKTNPNWKRAMVAAIMGTGFLAVTPDLPGVLASKASAADLLVNTDEATIHRLTQKAATIIVGNPSIADVNIQRGNLLVVMGKSPGTTNIIALDQAGATINEVSVHVRNTGNRSVTLHLGSGRYSYNCAPTCDRTLNAGDEKGGFETLQKQIAGKTTIATGSGGDGGGGSE